MFDFIERYKKILLIIAICVIVVMLVILYFVSRGVTPPPANAPANNDPGYSFLKQGLTDEEEYLMLEGKIITEQYGTYSKADYRGLLDVQNQSTENFKSAVQSKIDNLPAGANVSTVVDPETIKLTRDSGGVILTMNAAQTPADSPTQQITSTVKFVKQGKFWLVDNIIFSNE